MNIKMVALGLVSVAAVVGCSKANALITVNGESLSAEKVAEVVNLQKELMKKYAPQEYANYMMNEAAADTNMMRRCMAEFVFLQMEKKEVAKRGLKVTPEFRTACEKKMLKSGLPGGVVPKTIEEFFKKHPLGEENAKKNFEDFMIRELLATDVAKNVEIDPKEVTAIIDRLNAQNLEIAANNKLAEDPDAEKKVQDKMASIKKRIAAGEDFAKLAAEFSACPSGKRSGGSLGEFKRGEMVPEFDNVAFGLKVGEVSEPFKTRFGWHIVKLTGRIAPTNDVPEKIAASHILLSVPEKKDLMDVPSPEEVAEFMRRQRSMPQMQNIHANLILDCDIQTEDKEFAADFDKLKENVRSTLKAREEAEKNAAAAAEKAKAEEAKKAKAADVEPGKAKDAAVAPETPVASDASSKKPATPAKDVK